MINHDPQIGLGDKRITIDEVHLEPGGLEGNRVVILFREARRPYCVFGVRCPVREGFVQAATEEQRKRWNDPEGEGPQVDADMIVHGRLREQIEATTERLPQECDANSITWL